MNDQGLVRAEEFLLTHARLVDRRIFEHEFKGGSADAVAVAVRAYRNDDGGLGNALEPDLRVSSSQPIFVDHGLGRLVEGSASDATLLTGVCEFLAGVADVDGAIPYALPDAMTSPRADHWNGDYALAPSLHATAGICGKLLALGAQHEWMDRATAWCIGKIESEPTYSPHTMLNVLEFVRSLPDTELSARLWARVTGRLFEADYVWMTTPVTDYGLVPLRFAPRPEHPARALFTDAVIAEHLDHLIEQQQPDGGWPLFWEPPGPLAVLEWRGRVTVLALGILRAYRRI